MYQTLYRKYRPAFFDEVVGQKVIIQTLKNAVKNNTVNHAYLFTGPRGTGKTSVAKILAKTINCENLNDLVPCNKCVNCTQINNKQSVDIIEIDAASNNGVDEIRELKSKVNLVPSIGKYKVYIIDEVHMLTTGAFNALLKTLEEPPEHIIFILATTEPHKIPATILSRCQRFDFKKIHEKDIYRRLHEITVLEKIVIDEESLVEIARLSDGGLRDALSLLDQVIAYSKEKITIEDVHEINGTLTPLQIKEFICFIIQNDVQKLFYLIDEYDQKGKNFIKLSEELILFLRNCLISCIVPSFLKENVNNYELYEIDGLKTEKILNLIEKINQMIYDMKLSSHPKILFETSLIQFINFDSNKKISIETEKKLSCEMKDTQAIMANLNNIEKKSLKDNNTEKKLIIEEIKKIRINNTLCQFNKQNLLNWKKKISKVEMEVTNFECGKIASLIMDGELKAVGHHNFIFVYENNYLSNLFNEKINQIDKFLETIFHENIFTIATEQEEWNKIKNEFNSKTKSYRYIDEPPSLIEKLDKADNLTEIEKTFENIIEYEK